MTETYVSNPVLHTQDGDFVMQMMKIEQTHLGFEDHNILAWGILFTVNGEQQFTGMQRQSMLRDHEEFFAVILNTVGVKTWEQLQGKATYVLRREPEGVILGIANLNAPSERFVLFSELFETGD